MFYDDTYVICYERTTNRFQNDTTHICSTAEMLYVSDHHASYMKHYMVNL